MDNNNNFTKKEGKSSKKNEEMTMIRMPVPLKNELLMLSIINNAGSMANMVEILIRKHKSQQERE